MWKNGALSWALSECFCVHKSNGRLEQSSQRQTSVRDSLWFPLVFNDFVDLLEVREIFLNAMKSDTFIFTCVAARSYFSCFRTSMTLRALTDWPRKTSFLNAEPQSHICDCQPRYYVKVQIQLHCTLFFNLSFIQNSLFKQTNLFDLSH